MTRGSQAVLPLAVLRETRCEHQSILEIDGPRPLAALVRQRFLLHVASAGVHLERQDHKILDLDAREKVPTQGPFSCSKCWG